VGVFLQLGIQINMDPKAAQFFDMVNVVSIDLKVVVVYNIARKKFALQVGGMEA
jgi:hypothetical protein